MTKPRTKKTAVPLATVGKSRAIQLGVGPGESEDMALARMLARGTMANASTLIAFSRAQHGELSLMDQARALKQQGEAANRGDLSEHERMLSAQASTLNVIFNELARRAALNMGQYMEATERYMRLALKAQSQSRVTIETLAAVKNPPVVFARQANINNGGQQQVNNGEPSDTEDNARGTQAHAGETVFGPNELLEDCKHGRTQLDTRAAPATGRANQSLESMEALNRPAKR